MRLYQCGKAARATQRLLTPATSQSIPQCRSVGPKMTSAPKTSHRCIEDRQMPRAHEHTHTHTHAVSTVGRGGLLIRSGVKMS